MTATRAARRGLDGRRSRPRFSDPATSPRGGAGVALAAPWEPVQLSLFDDRAHMGGAPWEKIGDLSKVSLASVLRSIPQNLPLRCPEGGARSWAPFWRISQCVPETCVSDSHLAAQV